MHPIHLGLLQQLYCQLWLAVDSVEKKEKKKKKWLQSDQNIGAAAFWQISQRRKKKKY
jgi:hypothetical protein